MAEFTQEDLSRIHQRMDKAEHRIEKVEMAHGSHEQICSVRYEAIAEKQAHNEMLLKDIKEELDTGLKDISNEKMKVLIWAVVGLIGVVGVLTGYIFTTLHGVR